MRHLHPSIRHPNRLLAHGSCLRKVRDWNCRRADRKTETWSSCGRREVRRLGIFDAILEMFYRHSSVNNEILTWQTTNKRPFEKQVSQFIRQTIHKGWCITIFGLFLSNLYFGSTWPWQTPTMMSCGNGQCFNTRMSRRVYEEFFDAVLLISILGWTNSTIVEQIQSHWQSIYAWTKRWLHIVADIIHISSSYHGSHIHTVSNLKQQMAGHPDLYFSDKYLKQKSNRNKKPGWLQKLSNYRLRTLDHRLMSSCRYSTLWQHVRSAPTLDGSHLIDLDNCLFEIERLKGFIVQWTQTLRHLEVWILVEVMPSWRCRNTYASAPQHHLRHRAYHPHFLHLE